ncbi:MAG: CPBP family intramembrane metalloprotease [Elusimicrobia bacterium]|nr:CPBP family intramembrane metalloprotease [Elusimicrobiota bacterium]
MTEEKKTLSIPACFAAYLSAGLALVLTLLLLPRLTGGGFQKDSMELYLLQGIIFLAAALYTAKKLGIDLKGTAADYRRNLAGDLKLTVKYYAVYLGTGLALLAILTAGAMALMNFGTINMTGIADVSGPAPARASEIFYLRELSAEPPVKFALYLLATCLLIPIEEEIFFRRFLYVSLRRRMSLFLAILTSSLLFGAVHLNAGPVFAVVIGAFLAWVYERHRRLPVIIMLHGLINLTVTLVLTAIAIHAYNLSNPASPLNAPTVGDISSTMEAIPPPPEAPGPPLKPEYIAAMAITDTMQAAIQQYDGGFRLWDIKDFSDKQIKNYSYSEKALPYAIKGDYNADGIEDIVVSGRDPDGNISLALFSSGTSYNVIRVTYGDMDRSRAAEQRKTLQYTPSCVLTHRSKGEKLDTTEDSSPSPTYKVLERDAFFVDYYNDSYANLYEWDNSKSKFDLVGANLKP